MNPLQQHHLRLKNFLCIYRACGCAAAKQSYSRVLFTLILHLHLLIHHVPQLLPVRLLSLFPSPNSPYHRTGGTGYIGGSVLHTLAPAYPNATITILLRRTPPATLASSYPNVRVLQGDYTSTDILASAAENADVVLHNGDSDHEPSLQALMTGLLRRATPGYLIHLSGTGIVSDWAEETYLGVQNPKVWSDISSLGEIKQLPAAALHRNTETILHETVEKYGGNKIHVAVMCPPDIYGPGKGLGKRQSALVPVFVKEALSAAMGKRVFYHAEGTNTRSWVHIDDLMRLYMRVVGAAVAGKETERYFNANGYYFASTQEHSQLEFAKVTGDILKRHGLIEDAEPVQITLEQLDSMANLPGFPKLARYLFASNSRTRAERAEKLFRYKGEAPDLLQCLEADVLDAVQKA